MTRRTTILASTILFALSAVACGSGGSSGSGSSDSDLEPDEFLRESVSNVFRAVVEEDGLNEILRVVDSSSGGTTFSSRDFANRACPDGGNVSRSIAGSNIGEGAFSVSLQYNDCLRDSNSASNRVLNGGLQWTGSGDSASGSGSGSVFGGFDAQWHERIADRDGFCSVSSGTWSFSGGSRVQLSVQITCDGISFRCDLDSGECD